VEHQSKLHQIKGRTYFESKILADLCKAFHLTKSRTTSYHPMGNGKVECMNQSLLSLLHTYIAVLGEIPPVFYCTSVYHTTKHSSTDLFPFEVVFSTPIHIPTFYATAFLDSNDYASCLQWKLIQLKELVDANLVESAVRH